MLGAMTTPPRATAAASLASPDASPTLAFTSAAQTALAGGSFDARTWVNKKTGKDASKAESATVRMQVKWHDLVQ